MAAAIDLITGSTHDARERCCRLAEVAGEVCVTPAKPIPTTSKPKDERAEPKETEEKDHNALSPLLGVTKRKITGLARLGYTPDKCIICFTVRTLADRANHSDRRGFGFCDRCAHGFGTMQQAMSLMKAGVQPPPEMLREVKAFEHFLLTCFSRDDDDAPLHWYDVHVRWLRHQRMGYVDWRRVGFRTHRRFERVYVLVIFVPEVIEPRRDSHRKLRPS